VNEAFFASEAMGISIGRLIESQAPPVHNLVRLENNLDPLPTGCLGIGNYLGSQNASFVIPAIITVGVYCLTFQSLFALSLLFTFKVAKRLHLIPIG